MTKKDIYNILGIEEENKKYYKKDVNMLYNYLKKNNINDDNIIILNDDDYIYNKDLEIKKVITKIKKYTIATFK